MDRSATASLNQEELQTGLSLIGFSLDEAQTEELIKRFDESCNGLLEVDEFASLYHCLLRVQASGVAINADRLLSSLYLDGGPLEATAASLSSAGVPVQPAVTSPASAEEPDEPKEQSGRAPRRWGRWRGAS